MAKKAKTVAVQQIHPRPATPPAPARLAPKSAMPVPLEPDYDEGDEHRQFPRARISVPFHLSIGAGNEKRFRATLSSVNLSVSGAFLESTFFLPVGTRLHASFKLDDAEPAIECDANIIRVETPDPRSGQGRSGIAIKFVEFFSQTEVTLAKLFLGERLRNFAEEYLHSDRAKSLKSEFERVVDALAAWELQKVTRADDIWHMGS